MKKILVCQHVAHEILGTLNPLFKSHGFRIQYVNFGRYPHATPDLKGYDGLIILGGPMNVDQTARRPHLAYEVKLIQGALQREIPVLGICLGAQLIAKALGAPVTKNRVKEIGWYDVTLTKEGRRDPLFVSFKETEKLFQWHGDTFALPRGAIHLATSRLCENQAFLYGNKVYGFQFHLEVDEPMIERWLQVPDNQKEMEEFLGVNPERAEASRRVDPARIKRETPLYIKRLKDLSDRTFSQFIELFGAKKKLKRLSSR